MTTKNNSVNLYKLQVTGSKERKSLSGALKCSKVTSVEFWKEVGKKVKIAEITPAWITGKATEKQLNKVKKDGTVEKRAIWSAWMVETIIRQYVQTL
jgi:hypothetical protein